MRTKDISINKAPQGQLVLTDSIGTAPLVLTSEDFCSSWEDSEGTMHSNWDVDEAAKALKKVLEWLKQ